MLSQNLRKSDEDERKWFDDISEYSFDRSNCNTPVQTAISHLARVAQGLRDCSLDILTQISCLSSISNWHRWKCLRQDRRQYGYVPAVNLYQHLSYHPSHHDDSEEATKHYPTSLRNQIAFFIRKGDRAALNAVTCLGIQLDFQTLESPRLNPDTDHAYLCDSANSDTSAMGVSPVKRRRKCGPRFKPLTPQQHCQANNLNYQKVKDSAQKFSTIFKDYEEAISSRAVGYQTGQSNFSKGMVIWRHHTPYRDVFVLPDYDEETGVYKPNSFVHIEIFDDQQISKSVVCSCKTYQFHQVTVGGQLEDMQVLRRIDVGTEMTCMHVRFALNRLMHLCYDQLVAKEFQTDFERMLGYNTSVGDVPVLLVGEALPHVVTKFSILAQNEFSFIHLWFKDDRCFAECQEGLCKARRQKKIHLPRSKKQAYLLSTRENMCFHQKTFWENLDLAFKSFPDYFVSDECLQKQGKDEHDTNPPDIDNYFGGVPNCEDMELQTIKEGITFDKNTGLWQHSALTQKNCFRKNDEVLTEILLTRQSLLQPNRLISHQQAFLGESLMPPTHGEDGSPKLCVCGVR